MSQAFARNGWAALPGRAPAPGKVRVLLLSTREADHAVVPHLLAGSRYAAVPAFGLREAARAAGNLVFPVVLYDESLGVADWQLGLTRLMGVRRPPAVLLLSDGYDGGLTVPPFSGPVLDLLVRPLRSEVLVSMLNFAYVQWRLGSGRAVRRSSGRDRARPD